MVEKTLIEMLYTRANASPHSLYVRFFQHHGDSSTYTYAQTWDWAGAWATLFIERGVQRGEAVILALPNTADFLGAYFGALLAGGVPAPSVPLRRVKAEDHYLETLATRLRFIDAKILVVPEEQTEVADLPPLSALRNLTILTRRDLEPSAPAMAHNGAAHDLGLLQFTSGTSGNPKVVQLTHAALLAQMKNISHALALDPGEDSAVSWLPLFHDMGLIGFLLTPIYCGVGVNMMPTEDFMRRPSTWIKALSEFRATLTGGPPSAYVSCARFVKPAEIAQYDLSQVRCALVGAEMISPESMQLFSEKFRPTGFRATSLMPAYGLAENGLAVTLMPRNHGVAHDTIDLELMQTAGVAQALAPEAAGKRPTRAVVAVGVPLQETEVAIVNANGEKLQERQVGEIIVRSPSLMLGYYNHPEASRQALQEGWLWTGDLGYIADHRLHVTGRKKEVLIVGGNNYYPDDLEPVAEAAAGGRPGSAVAIAYEDPSRGTEVIVILVETGKTDHAEREALRLHLRQALAESGYPIGEVVLLRPKTIQSTMNGKRKRLECKMRYLQGEFS